MIGYLSKVRGLAGLVLRDLVHGVLAALLSLAESPSLLRHVDHVWDLAVVAALSTTTRTSLTAVLRATGFLHLRSAGHCCCTA